MVHRSKINANSRPSSAFSVSGGLGARIEIIDERGHVGDALGGFRVGNPALPVIELHCGSIPAFVMFRSAFRVLFRSPGMIVAIVIGGAATEGEERGCDRGKKVGGLHGAS
jgi:hypothetical protein